MPLTTYYVLSKPTREEYSKTLKALAEDEEKERENNNGTKS